jgi:oligoribonuclease NrnB/cAMP/cGMP phosphodiesterase (DHH superfamily)
MRLKHYSHIDSDGAGGVIISKRVFGDVDHELCDYENINDRVSEFIRYMYRREAARYDMVAITDISVNKEVADLITKAEKDFPNTKFVLLDHHERVFWLNEYSWANVIREIPVEGSKPIRTCGTSLWYDYLKDNGFIAEKDVESLGLFAETVRQWDTFDWMYLHNEKANELNTLLIIKGKERFIERFVKNIEVEWTYDEKVLLDEEKLRIRRYVETKRREMRIYTTGSGHSVGIVFAEQHMSTVGLRICRFDSRIDFVIVYSLSTGRASMRTVKDNIRLDEIAEKLGGGGRPKRAGFPLEGLLNISFDLSII